MAEDNNKPKKKEWIDKNGVSPFTRSTAYVAAGEENPRYFIESMDLFYKDMMGGMGPNREYVRVDKDPVIDYMLGLAESFKVKKEKYLVEKKRAEAYEERGLEAPEVNEPQISAEEHNAFMKVGEAQELYGQRGKFAVSMSEEKLGNAANELGYSLNYASEDLLELIEDNKHRKLGDLEGIAQIAAGELFSSLPAVSCLQRIAEKHHMKRLNRVADIYSKEKRNREDENNEEEVENQEEIEYAEAV